MSGEYYCIEEMSDTSNFQNDGDPKTSNRSVHNPCENQLSSTKMTQDFHLLEIEDQLEIAENRCNNLKGQLDSMKKSCRNICVSEGIAKKKLDSQATKHRTPKKHRALNQPSTSHETSSMNVYNGGKDVIPQKSSSSSAMYSDPSKPNHRQVQNSTSIDNNHTGSALQAIKNIIAGLIDPVQMQDKSKDECRLRYAYVENPQSNNACGTYTMVGRPFSPRLKKRLFEQQRKVEKIAKEANEHKLSDTRVKLKDFSRQVRSGTSMFKENNQMYLNKRKRTVKRLKTSKISLARKISDVNSLTKDNSVQISTENLIELYHNIDAKSSQSDDSVQIRGQTNKRRGAGDSVCNTVFKHLYSKSPRTLSPINENMTIKSKISRCIFRHHSPKNYELPTIASKLKRVTKNYLRTINFFNFKTIPFCPTASISPSHNIGINFQQVMSVLKSKQPVSEIPPTLAHNINLAARRIQGGPLSTFVSHLSTEIGSGYLTCPLVRRNLNYNKLQEMAKAIPEEVDEDLNDSKNSDDIVSVTSRKKDEDVSPPAPPAWTVNGSTSRCTCVSQRGVSLQQVMNKYQIGPLESTPTITRSKFQSPLNRHVRTPHHNSNAKQRTAVWVSNGVKQVSEQIHTSDTKEQTDPNGKERNMKLYLKNLYDEFDALNTQYETLLKSNEKTLPENMQLLQEMENKLNHKEDEINTVMSLYTELTALKGEMKRLKERESRDKINTHNISGKKSSTVALHLTKILREIQNYKKQAAARAHF
ncbi:hypothetical protein FQA39_LY17398 [Lamprigera yunnana]|nr:hypothetical protein FQA39_LY17398 [Lamprigera yunnana]